MTTTADVAVVGGGVIGCAIAYHLAQAGASVTIIERDLLGAHASSAAAGMLAPLAEAHGPGPFLNLGLASLRLFPSLVETLRQETGVDCEYRRSGILRVAFSEEEDEELKKRVAWQRALNLGVERLTGDDIRSLEPNLSPALRGGVYSEEEAHVNPHLLMRALATSVVRHDVQVHENIPVSGLRTAGRRALAVRTPQGEVGADAFVLAAGPWTGHFGRRLGVALPVFPVRGQMLALAGMALPTRHIVWGPNGYLVPRVNGLLYAGATVERVGFRERTSRWGLARLQRMAATLMPVLRNARIASAWAGLRPGSADGLPILGRLPGWDNVFVATGHFRNGILLAAITGRLMADLVITGETSPLLQPFSPKRFLASD